MAEIMDISINEISPIIPTELYKVIKNDFNDVLFYFYEQTENPEIAQFLKIEYWTTIVVYKNNKEIAREMGLTSKKNIYDLILVLNFNSKPIIKNKGSAIFLHIANKNFTPTKGCIAIQKKSFVKILSYIKKTTKIIIY